MRCPLCGLQGAIWAKLPLQGLVKWALHSVLIPPPPGMRGVGLGQSTSSDTASQGTEIGCTPFHTGQVGPHKKRQQLPNLCWYWRHHRRCDAAKQLLRAAWVHSAAGTAAAASCALLGQAATAARLACRLVPLVRLGRLARELQLGIRCEAHSLCIRLVHGRWLEALCWLLSNATCRLSCRARTILALWVRLPLVLLLLRFLLVLALLLLLVPFVLLALNFPVLVLLIRGACRPRPPRIAAACWPTRLSFPWLLRVLFVWRMLAAGLSERVRRGALELLRPATEQQRAAHSTVEEYTRMLSQRRGTHAHAVSKRKVGWCGGSRIPLRCLPPTHRQTNPPFITTSPQQAILSAALLVGHLSSPPQARLVCQLL
eukprot:353939-Chlamydomonas_euryale.AAC.25